VQPKTARYCNLNDKANKMLANSGKGHNETIKVVNPLGHTIPITVAVGEHVPENGGTCSVLTKIDSENFSREILEIQTLIY
jgi:hypothetical protein